MGTIDKIGGFIRVGPTSSLRADAYPFSTHKDVHKYTPDEISFYAQRENAYKFWKDSFKAFDSSWPMFVLGSAESEAATAGAAMNLEKLIRDPELRKMLTPTYPVGCRRLTPHERGLDFLI